MKKILLVGLFLGLANLASAQAQLTTNTCPGTGCVDYNVAGQGSIGIQITGTWSGTVTFQSSINNSTFTDLRVVSSADTSSAGATTTTANGSFQATVTGLSVVRVRFTTPTSGTVLVNSRTTNQAAKFNGISGGGVVSACASSDTQILFTDGTSCAGDSGLVWNKTTNLFNVNNGTITAGSSDLTIPLMADTPLITAIGASVAISPVIMSVGLAPNRFGAFAMMSPRGTPAVPTTNVNGDVTGEIQFYGFNGTSFTDTAFIESGVEGAVVPPNNAQGYLSMYVQSGAGNQKFFHAHPTGSSEFLFNLTTAGLTTSGSGLVVANVGANSCGTTAATIAGNSNSFEITVGAGAGTQCRVTFPTAAPVRYNCTVTDSTTTIATRSTFVDTTHTDFFGAFVAGDVVTALCLPR